MLPYIHNLTDITRKIKFKDWTFFVGELGDGYYIQVKFKAGDSSSPHHESVEQNGRKWYISRYSTESEVVQTCLKAVLTALEHEAREEFTYNNINVFHPHLPMSELVLLSIQREVRTPPDNSSSHF